MIQVKLKGQEYNAKLDFRTLANIQGELRKRDIKIGFQELFENDKLGVVGKRLYVLYAVKFAPPSISSKTKEGTIEDGTVELQFTVRELSTGEIFRFVDTDSEEAAEGIEESWFTQVQL